MTETADTAPVRQELERVAATPQQKTIVNLIRGNRPVLERALGGALTVEQFETAAMTYLRLQPKLWECNPDSVVGGLRLGAQLGLSLGPLGHFYLVPFKGEAQFVLGYRGMVALAYRSGMLKSIEANVVREGDLFDYRKGSRKFLDYREGDDTDENPRVAVYALAELTTGGKPFEVLSPRKVERRMKRSASHKLATSPWQTDTDAMWRKSAVRALQPWLPQTQALALAAQRDEDIVTDLTDDGEAVIEA